VGKQRQKTVYVARGIVAHGVFCLVCPMCVDARRDPPRNKFMEVADIHFCIHDRAGVYWSIDNVPVVYLD
jgi:hypothetical protein